MNDGHRAPTRRHSDGSRRRRTTVCVLAAPSQSAKIVESLPREKSARPGCSMTGCWAAPRSRCRRSRWRRARSSAGRRWRRASGRHVWVRRRSIPRRCWRRRWRRPRRPSSRRSPGRDALSDLDGVLLSAQSFDHRAAAADLEANVGGADSSEFAEDVGALQSDRRRVADEDNRSTRRVRDRRQCGGGGRGRRGRRGCGRGGRRGGGRGGGRGRGGRRNRRGGGGRGSRRRGGRRRWCGGAATVVAVIAVEATAAGTCAASSPEPHAAASVAATTHRASRNRIAQNSLSSSERSPRSWS